MDKLINKIKGFVIAKPIISSILAILIVALLLTTGGLLLSQSKDSLSEIGSFISKKASQTASLFSNDKDGDGLSNKEEEKYGTDPENADTDGDGYLDGEEIASGYNPLKSAPGDELSEAEAVTPRPLPQNLTNALAKTLTAGLTSNKFGLSKDENDINPEVIDKLIDDSFSGQEVASLFSLPDISDQEIKISSEQSPEAARSYASKIYDIIDKNFSSSLFLKSGASEIEVAQAAMESGDFEDLDKYIAAYKQAYDDIKKVRVPVNWKELHKKQLAIFDFYQKVLGAFRDVQDDPLRATIAAEAYPLIIKYETELGQEVLALAQAQGLISSR